MLYLKCGCACAILAIGMAVLLCHIVGTCSCLISTLSFPALEPTPDDSPNNQLVAPPDGNRSTFDVTYLGALTDKWLGWAPLRNMQSVCNKHSKQPPLPLLPPLILLGQFVVLLLLMMFAGNVVNSGPSKGIYVILLYKWELSTFVTPLSSSTQSMVSGMHPLYWRSQHVSWRLVYQSRFYRNFQFPEILGELSIRKQCVSGSFSLPMHKSLGTRLTSRLLHSKQFLVYVCPGQQVTIG